MKTEDDENFLVSDGKVDKERVLIFASKTGLEILSKTVQWHANGTFKTAPKMFQQVYIIFGFYKDKLFTCAYSVTEQTRTSLQIYTRPTQIQIRIRVKTINSCSRF
jgi:hypothetical protein